MASAASSKLIDKRAKKEPRKRFEPLPIKALLHDPRERLVCAQMAKVRKCLRLSPEDFAKGVGVKANKLALYEAQRLSWPAEAVAEALTRISELCAVAQGDIEEAVGIAAELESQPLL